eukprot:3421494-Amphidinium_carterae.1
MTLACTGQVCDFENLLQAMWQRHASRLPPAKLQLPGAAPVLPGNRKVLPAYLSAPKSPKVTLQMPGNNTKACEGTDHVRCVEVGCVEHPLLHQYMWKVPN